MSSFNAKIHTKNCSLKKKSNFCKQGGKLDHSRYSQVSLLNIFMTGNLFFFRNGGSQTSMSLSAIFYPPSPTPFYFVFETSLRTYKKIKKLAHSPCNGNHFSSNSCFWLMLSIVVLGGGGGGGGGGS